MGCKNICSKNLIPAITAWTLLIVLTSVYLFIVSHFHDYKIYLIYPIHGTVIIFVIVNFARATFMDPGTYPLGVPEERPNTENRPPLYKNIEIKGVSIRMKWCTTCEFYRPPRCSHCSVCKHCIDTFDHHCPWVNNCIGRRNYRYFFVFLISLSMHMVAVFSTTIYYIVINRVNLLHPVVITSIVLVVLVGLLMLPVMGLTGFHIFLVSNGRTTNEQVTSKFNLGLNPFDRGCPKNCCSVLCGPQLPSLHYRPRVKVVKVYSALYKPAGHTIDIKETNPDAQYNKMVAMTSPTLLHMQKHRSGKLTTSANNMLEHQQLLSRQGSVQGSGGGWNGIIPPGQLSVMSSGHNPPQYQGQTRPSFDVPQQQSHNMMAKKPPNQLQQQPYSQPQQQPYSQAQQQQQYTQGQQQYTQAQQQYTQPHIGQNSSNSVGHNMQQQDVYMRQAEQMYYRPQQTPPPFTQQQNYREERVSPRPALHAPSHPVYTSANSTDHPSFYNPGLHHQYPSENRPSSRLHQHPPSERQTPSVTGASSTTTLRPISFLQAVDVGGNPSYPTENTGVQPPPPNDYYYQHHHSASHEDVLGDARRRYGVQQQHPGQHNASEVNYPYHPQVALSQQSLQQFHQHQYDQQRRQYMGGTASLPPSAVAGQFFNRQNQPQQVTQTQQEQARRINEQIEAASGSGTFEISV